MKRIIFALFISLFISIYANGHKYNLKTDTFNLPQVSFQQKDVDHIADSVQVKEGLQEELYLAKRSGDITVICNLYFELAKVSRIDDALKYADSIIVLSKDTNDFNYPGKAYLFKARIYGSQSKYQKSMDELAKANHYANQNENVDLQYGIKYSIAFLQGDIGNHKEGLEVLQSVVEYYEKKNKNNEKEYQFHYIQSLFALSGYYSSIEEYNLAYSINKKALDLSLRTKDSILYPYLLANTGITHFRKKEYSASIDAMLKLKKIISRKENYHQSWIVTDLILGKSYFDQGNTENALRYFKVVDSTIFAENFFEPSIQSMYTRLIKYYKEKKEVKKQLFYIDRLLVLDSILDTKTKYVSQQIEKNYNTPNLLLEKQRIIDSLEREKREVWIISIILLVLLSGVLWILYKNNQKRKLYKQRFLAFIAKQEAEKKINNASEKEQFIDQKDLGIAEHIVQDILEKLNVFEQNKGYLNGELTLIDLAKEFETNYSYLSRIINLHKNKSFSNYMNDLRIEHAIDKIQKDPKFRQYTIKAIANEIGFNTTETFSKSFYKKTGVYPSFFLKEIEKREKH